MLKCLNAFAYTGFNAVIYTGLNAFVYTGLNAFVYTGLNDFVYTDLNAFVKTCLNAFVYTVGCFRKTLFSKKNKATPSRTPLGIYKPDQKAFFVWTSLGGHTTKSKMRGFYIVDFHSACS